MEHTMRLQGLLILSGLAVLPISLLASSPPDPINEENYQNLPWMTGPILAPAGHVVPGGHVNWEPYLFVTDAFGTYNNRGKVVHDKPTVTTQPMLSLTVGVTQWMDFQAIIPYSFNTKEGKSDNNWADISLMFGFQVMNGDPNSLWYPDLRVTLEETFPAGNFEQLNPELNGTDSTGIGAYQTAIGLNFQHVWHSQTLKYFSGVHFLRGRLSYTYTMPSSVNVRGINAFGGVQATNGSVNVGNKSVLDIGLEYSMTANWVLATDIVYNNETPSEFSGYAGFNTNGSPASVGLQSNHQYSLAPAIEYNWNEQLGMIAGAWFTVGGDNATEFAGGAIALNYYD